MTEPSSRKAREQSPLREAIRRCFEPHPIVHFVYAFCLFFTSWSLFFWLFERLSSSPGRHFFANVGRNAVVSIVVTICTFVAERWRWSKDRSSSSNVPE